MTTKTKTLLIICIVSLGAGLAFVTGAISVRNAATLYVALPLGATFFGLFLVSRMLEKETVLYEQEQHLLHSAPGSASASNPPATSASSNAASRSDRK